MNRMTPSLEKVATLTIDVAKPLSAGQTGLGLRRLIPIKSGTITGKIQGRILPGGADSQIIRPDGRTDLSARYLIETLDGEIIYLENNGIRQVEDAYREHAAQGEIIPAEHVYFRTVPTFETGSKQYRWLMDKIFIGAATRLENQVLLDIYQVN
ncbi:hypothetical protein CHH64_03120 [Terribacillus saccharophilus]|uniref:UPF0311 protein CHH64_03120 n=2 Tax=Terribacillus saccharophilus TaxID=361277 RepID=A0A268AF19_9BACI|nr:hypothetical protein CHH64_03120 [Terribacillus saccharophilus]PAF18189.1 hypothetical protein CHH51_09160 [Terribacillus saccharophilus]PAF23619.1 hypothetical protein CHH49_03425 [Terribacillus saccharophilus]